MSIIKKLLGGKLGIDREIAVLTIISTLLIMVDYYYSPTGFNYLDSILLYIVIPGFCTIFIFRKPLSDYGFKLGDWKLGLILTLLGCLLMSPIIWYLGSRYPAMGNYYWHAVDGMIWKKVLRCLAGNICLEAGCYSDTQRNTARMRCGSNQYLLPSPISVNQL